GAVIGKARPGWVCFGRRPRATDAGPNQSYKSEVALSFTSIRNDQEGWPDPSAIVPSPARAEQKPIEDGVPAGSRVGLGLDPTQRPQLHDLVTGLQPKGSGRDLPDLPVLVAVVR